MSILILERFSFEKSFQVSLFLFCSFLSIIQQIFTNRYCVSGACDNYALVKKRKTLLVLTAYSHFFIKECEASPAAPLRKDEMGFLFPQEKKNIIRN